MSEYPLTTGWIQCPDCADVWSKDEPPVLYWISRLIPRGDVHDGRGEATYLARCPRCNQIMALLKSPKWRAKAMSGDTSNDNP